MVANPRAAREFARAMMQRSKSNPPDAQVLREFAARMPFQPWVRPNANTLTLWAMVRRLQTLSAAEKNRLHAVGVAQALPACLRRSIQRMLRSFKRESKQLRAAARRYIAADDQLQRKYQLLCSAKGFAENSAIQILGELAMLPADRNVRQWVAFAALDPREHSSGSSVHKRPRISKMGNRHLRHALFMPALVASRREPHLHGFYEHLLAKEKTKRLALMAVARKLLHAIYGMFRSGKPYDGARVYQLPSSLPTPLAQPTT
jgi:transposase